MAEDILGSPQALLSVASDATSKAQAQENFQAEQNQKVANNAIEPQQAQGVARGQAQGAAQGSQVLITPQLAQGAAKMTGDDSWNRTVGTKMDSRIYSALLTAGAQKSYHQDLLNDHDKLEGMREASRQKLLEEGYTDKAGLQKLKEDHQNEIEDLKSRHKKELEELESRLGKYQPKGKGSGASEDPKDKEFLKTYRSYSNDLKGMNGTLLAQMAKQDSERAKELQDKAIFMQKNKSRFDSLQGTGGAGNESNQSDIVTVRYKAKDGTVLTKQIHQGDMDRAKKLVPELEVVNAKQ